VLFVNPGSEIGKNPEHISESLKQFFGADKDQGSFLTLDPGSRMEKSDPGSGAGINIPYPQGSNDAYLQQIRTGTIPG
jgi:hypothetical protein